MRDDGRLFNEVIGCQAPRRSIEVLRLGATIVGLCFPFSLKLAGKIAPSPKSNLRTKRFDVYCPAQ